MGSAARRGRRSHRPDLRAHLALDRRASPVEAKFAAAVELLHFRAHHGAADLGSGLRLRVMSSGTSAGVLAAFALIALALGSRTRQVSSRPLRARPPIVMAFALLLARNDIVPFTAALLAWPRAMEFAAWRAAAGRASLAAIAADCVRPLALLSDVEWPRHAGDVGSRLALGRAYAATRSGADLYRDRRDPDGRCGAGLSLFRKWRRPRSLS